MLRYVKAGHGEEMMLFGLSRQTGRWQKTIEQLDLENDYFRIAQILFNHEFSIDILLATEIAQLRTFTIPSISHLLHRTGQYETEGPKRLDDTKAILVEMTEDSVHSPRGQKMAEHLNRIHSHYSIANEDYLYTLSTFIFDPFLWIEQYGWRQLTPKEKQAVYLYYKDMGEAMHIQNIPPSIDSFWEWRLAYEHRKQRYAETNTQVALGLLDAVCHNFPTWTHSWVLASTCAMINDAQFLGALGFSQPGALLHRLVQGAMSVRKRLLRYFTFYENHSFKDSWIFQHYPTYPEGYNPEELGPTKIVRCMAKQDKQKQGCPFPHGYNPTSHHTQQEEETKRT